MKTKMQDVQKLLTVYAQALYTELQAEYCLAFDFHCRSDDIAYTTTVYMVCARQNEAVECLH